jgi:hypothetical protein
MAVVKSIGPISAMKIQGLLGAIMGLIIGAFLSLAAMLGLVAGGSEMGAMGMLFGIGAIIIVPIFYGVVGAIGGLILALIYNGCAKIVGGLEIEI